METSQRTNGFGVPPPPGPLPVHSESGYSRPVRHVPWAKMILSAVVGVLSVALVLVSLVAVGTRSKLADAKAELATVSDNLGDEKARTEDLRFKLEGAQGELASAEAKVGEQRKTILAAQDCISGVISSMSSFLDGFVETAFFEMRAVRPKCDRVANADTSGGVGATTF